MKLQGRLLVCTKGVSSEGSVSSSLVFSSEQLDLKVGAIVEDVQNGFGCSTTPSAWVLFVITVVTASAIPNVPPHGSAGACAKLG